MAPSKGTLRATLQPSYWLSVRERCDLLRCADWKDRLGDKIRWNLVGLLLEIRVGGWFKVFKSWSALGCLLPKGCSDIDDEDID